MSNLLKDKSENKPNPNNGGSSGLMSNDEMRKFIDAVEYIKKKGGIPIKVEYDVKRQVTDVLNPFQYSVRDATDEIKDVQKNTVNAVENKLPGLIINAFEKADVKGKFEKAAQSITWENALLKVVSFLLLSCLSIFGLAALYMESVKRWPGIKDPMIAIAFLIGWSYLTFIAGKAVGRNDKY